MMTNDFDSPNEEDFSELIGEIKAAGEVPEPSPLFWNHLSARVRDAVAVEPIARGWWSIYWRPLAAVVGSVAFIALVVVLRTGTPGRLSQTEAAASEHELIADVEVTEMWRLIQVAAPKVEMESMRDTGWMPSQYAADQAIESLTPSQREALVRLLRKEMGVSE